MISPRIPPVALLLCLAIFTGSARAQTTQNDETALREKAVALLESVGGQLGTLQSAENRARLGANIADSLWTHNEKLARSILLQVEADIRAELQKWEPQTGRDASLPVFLKLRADTVERIAKRDPEAALAFLKGTELESDKLPKFIALNFDGLEIRLAQKVAADNPEAAVSLGREALNRGFHYDFLALLRRLNKKHKQSAQVLHREVIKKLQSSDLITDWNARYFARNLARSFQPPAADPAIYRELMSTLVTTALKNGCAEKLTDNEEFRRDFCYWLGPDVPLLERFDSRAAQLKHLRSTGQVSYEVPTALQQLSDLLEDGTTDEILAAASEYPEHADVAYSKLIERALQVDNFERARAIVTTHIADPEKRKFMLAHVEIYEKRAARNQPSLAEIEEKLSAITQPLQRIEFLLMSAHQLGAGDQKAALKLLDRASDLIDLL